MKINQINVNNIGIMILSYNSFETIRKTIESVKDFASQILVVDSGSTDGTPQLVSRLGADLVFRKWTDDFASQRNFALKHIRTKWVMMLDSDEYLSNFEYRQFVELTKKDNIGGINVIIKNLIDNNSSQFYHRYTRIFLNHKNIRFTGKIHEQIRESIEENGFSVYDSDFEITHTGYSEANEQKYDRNLRILNEELLVNNQDDFVKYHIASTYFAKGDLDNSRDIFLSIIDSKQLSQEQIDMIYIRLAQIFLQNDDYDLVEKYVERIPLDDNLHGLRNYIYSSVKLKNKDLIGAYRLLTDKKTIESSLFDKKILTSTTEQLSQMLENKNFRK